MRKDRIFKSSHSCVTGFLTTVLVSGILTILPFVSVQAEDAIGIGSEGQYAHSHDHGSATANDHAPIGVMGDHMHKQGEWMLSYRYMKMRKDGSRKGTNSISANEIVTSEPNRFFGMAGQPATLRVVPEEMRMEKHSFGIMYAPLDNVTLTAMIPYIQKEGDTVTYAGAAGTTIRGRFSMENEGWGDLKLNSLIRLYDDEIHHLHVKAGLSVPTGSLDATGTMLAPSGARMRNRMAYAMQLGTGTYDFLPGVTYTGRTDAWEWGAQYSAEIRLEDENDEDYAWGDQHSITAWGSYEWAPWISTSLRLKGTTQDNISGIDSRIVGPNQAADPDNYGGETLDAGFGVNLIATSGVLKGHRLAFEAVAPVYSDLNGPQLGADYMLVIGWQKAF